MRAEGKEYVVKDGDVLNFLFNVPTGAPSASRKSAEVGGLRSPSAAAQWDRRHHAGTDEQTERMGAAKAPLRAAGSCRCACSS